MDHVRFPVRNRKLFLLAGLFLALALFQVTMAGVVLAHRERPINPGETDGFGKERLLVFNYTEDFQCAGLDGLHPAPCKVGVAPGPTAEGDEPEDVRDLFVIVPFFDADGDMVEMTGDGAGVPGVPAGTLNAIFGVSPDGWDPMPGVDVQCPEPGVDFGFCFNHPHDLDLGPVLATLGIVPAGTVVHVVLPNHSHIVEETPGGSVPWDIIINLVFDPDIWPDADGNCPAGMGCLTSVENLREAQDAGQVSGDILSDLFLFFGVHNLRNP